ncbi:protein WHAT'S THIS FACTOR 9, mitochondrial [Beta vulgaris subsp. vulgaris]|uniref:protein WHAT'S THIS FACTOR 9, mitochondrial n=1 Tax=Beta vulgaris subsp. vulgaris TaxID=3555 RepID=UPI0020370166|nr:protein WHAT'S THIS FACTOR 9, mitochondrial [Beta vulgaris subsp. vulgaris]
MRNPMLFYSLNRLNSSLLVFVPHISLRRAFIDAKIKWVRDPYLDFVVSREKNLLPCLSLKHLLLSSPSFSLPISLASLHKPRLNLPSHTTSLYFFHKYPSLFTLSPPLVKLTPEFLALHNEEQEIHDSVLHKESAALRLVQLLMLTRACRIPINILNDLRFDLGLPDDYLLDFVSYFPEYFRVCSLKCSGNNGELGGMEVGLELISWRKQLGVPAILKKVFGDDLGCNSHRGRIVEFPMCFAPGFDLEKKARDWVEEWQCLPYISPYEDAFHLAPRSDQAEKWTVAVLHEILSLLVSKKTEMKNILRLGEYLGFGLRFKKALFRHPGIFYVSNKIKTQTVVLKEAFRKDVLLENHPLIGMRHRYVYLINKSRKGKKRVKYLSSGSSLLMSRSDSDKNVNRASEK